MPDAPRRPTVAIGPPLGRYLDVARAAGQSVLLVGPHGIGKSEYLAAWAAERGLDACVLDLSLLEATDLTGIPFLDGGVTHFAPPAALPTGERPALLVLEELNRCDRSVRQPCLQLLTARRLNEYRLPEACMVAACINPDDEGYEVDALDPALASRFVVVPVKPNRDEWLAWALGQKVFSGVVRFVQKFPQSFEQAPPRAWTQASAMLGAAIRQGWRVGELEPLLATVLPPMAARALALELRGGLPSIPPRSLLQDPARYHPMFREWMEEQRLDAVEHVLDALCRHIDVHGLGVEPATPRLGELMAILDLVPPDLGLRVLERVEVHTGKKRKVGA